MRHVSDKVAEKFKTHFVVSNIFFFENRVVYEMMRKNTAEPNRPQMTIWRMRIACWIPKATETNPEYVILFFQITSIFPCQNHSTTLSHSSLS